MIWLYDIHLLARAMSASQWQRVIEVADGKGLQPVCVDGLQAAVESLGTDMPEEIRQRLSRYGSEGVTPVACFDLPSWRWELLGLRRARSWRARINFVAEHLFPARGYVQEKYRCASRKLLPFYYIRRAVEGICRRF